MKFINFTYILTFFSTLFYFIFRLGKKSKQLEYEENTRKLEEEDRKYLKNLKANVKKHGIDYLIDKLPTKRKRGNSRKRFM